MRIEGLTYVLENRAELNNPVLTDIEWSHYYRSIPESSGWRVAVGFRKPNDPNWYEVETDWAWLPDDLQMRLRPHITNH